MWFTVSSIFRDSAVRSSIRLFYLNALRSQSQAVEAPIPYDAIVRGGCDSNARVVVGGVFDGVWVKTRRTKLQHGRHDIFSVGEANRRPVRPKAADYSHIQRATIRLVDFMKAMTSDDALSRMSRWDGTQCLGFPAVCSSLPGAHLLLGQLDLVDGVPGPVLH
jgi:hypothetical protein